MKPFTCLTTAMLLTSLSGLSAPIFAQEEPKPGEDDKAKRYENMDEGEIVRELLGLMKEVSGGMEGLQGELAKASLPKRKLDEMAAELNAVIEKLKAGRAQELPEGLRKYFDEHPEKLAELLDTSKDEAAKLSQDRAKLVEKLGAVPDKLKQLVEESGVLEDVVRAQAELESKLGKTLERQKELGNKTVDDLESVLEAAYALRSQSDGQGQPKPNPGEQPGEDKQGEKDGEKPDNVKKPGDGAKEEYTGDGKKPDSKMGETERVVDENVWDAKPRDKNHETSRDGEGDKSEPARYRRMWDRFSKTVGKASAPAAPAAPGAPSGE